MLLRWWFLSLYREGFLGVVFECIMEGSRGWDFRVFGRVLVNIV